MENRQELQLALVEYNAGTAPAEKNEGVIIPAVYQEKTYVMPMSPQSIGVDFRRVTVKKPQMPMRRSVDLYSWWQHKDKEYPVCIVQKDYEGQGAGFRVTHVRTLKIWESDPTVITIEKFWEMVDNGIVTNVTLPIQVNVVRVESKS